MIASFLKHLVLGPSPSLQRRDLKKMTGRHPFSAFLNYLAYDPDTKLYLNQDNTIGMLWECSPVIFAGPKTITALEGMFRAGLPKGSIIQLIFHADSRIEPILKHYEQDRVRDNPLVRTNTESVLEYLRRGKNGIEACSNIPVRRFRLFVTVKLPEHGPGLPKPEELGDESKLAPLLDIRRQINETLKAAMLFPRQVGAEDLLEWNRRLLNCYPEGYPEQNFSSYDSSRPLR